MRNALKYVGPVLGGAAFITAALFSDEYIAEISYMDDTVVIIEDETAAAIKGINYGMPCEREIGPFYEVEPSDEYLTEETVGTEETDGISTDFTVTEETTAAAETTAITEEVINEQETGEERGVQSDFPDESTTVCTETQGVVNAPAVEQTAGVQQAAQPAVVCDAAKAEVVSTVSAPEGDAAASIPELLKAHLDAAGIGWWYPYAYAQMMQESGGNPWAENINGLDKGIFQYRISYWAEPESIFDAEAQIRKYTGQVAARLNAGLSIEETISRHYTSDYVTAIDWDYVNRVLSRMQK